MSVYLGCKLLINQVLLKKMEDYLFFKFYFFQDS